MNMPIQNQAEFIPVRRSAMHHKHLELGASMVERYGWQQPAHYGSGEADTKNLLEAVGICDLSPQAKFVIKGDQPDQLVSKVFPTAQFPDIGKISLEDFEGSPAALCQLAQDEILCVASTETAPELAEGLQGDSGQCAHALEITSGLAGVGIAGPQAARLLSMLSELNTSVSAFPNLRCAQSKFADIHGTLLRIDIGDMPAYQLYFGREFGEYVWEAIVEAAGVCGGGPVGLDAWHALAG